MKRSSLCAPLLGALVLATSALWCPDRALAQSVSHGQTLYAATLVSGNNSCAASACHGSAPSRGMNRIALGSSASVIKSGVSSVSQMNFLASALTDSDYNDLAAYIASATGRTATYIAVATAPAATLSASSVGFGAVTVGNTASVHTVTLTNAGTAALTITTLRSNSTAFALTHDCPATLAIGSACTLSLTFTPASAISYSSTATLVTNAAPATQTLTLTGTGVAAPTALLSWSGNPTALTFASTAVGARSAVQTVTLLNQGSVNATLTAVALGGADATEFVTGGTCAAGGTVPANGSCTVTVTFEPTLVGARTATLQITAVNAGTPTPLALSGTAVAAAAGGTSSSPGGSSAGGGTPSAAGENSNVGGGGCSIVPLAQGTQVQPDPALWGLTGLAVLALLWRRRARCVASRPPVPDPDN